MNSTLTVSGNVTLVSAMTIAGSSGLTLNAASTLTSHGKTWPNALTLSDSTGTTTYTLADNWTVSGTLTVIINANFNITINSNNLNLGSNLTINGSGGSIIGTTTIILNGTGTWSETGSSLLKNNLTINTGGTITISGTVYYSTGTFTYTTGTVTTTGSTLTLSLSTTIPTGITWNNLTLSDLAGGPTYTLSGDLTVSGTLTINVNAGFNITINGNNLYVAGGLAVTGGTGSIIGTTKWYWYLVGECRYVCIKKQSHHQHLRHYNHLWQCLL